MDKAKTEELLEMIRFGNAHADADIPEYDRDERAAVVVYLLDEGHSKMDISRLLGIHRHTVDNDIKHYQFKAGRGVIFETPDVMAQRINRRADKLYEKAMNLVKKCPHCTGLVSKYKNPPITEDMDEKQIAACQKQTCPVCNGKEVVPSPDLRLAMDIEDKRIKQLQSIGMAVKKPKEVELTKKDGNRSKEQIIDAIYRRIDPNGSGSRPGGSSGGNRALPS